MASNKFHAPWDTLNAGLLSRWFLFSAHANRQFKPTYIPGNMFTIVGNIDTQFPDRSINIWQEPKPNSSFLLSAWLTPCPFPVPVPNDNRRCRKDCLVLASAPRGRHILGRRTSAALLRVCRRLLFVLCKIDSEITCDAFQRHCGNGGNPEIKADVYNAFII